VAWLQPPPPPLPRTTTTTMTQRTMRGSRRLHEQRRAARLLPLPLPPLRTSSSHPLRQRCARKRRARSAPASLSRSSLSRRGGDEQAMRRAAAMRSAGVRGTSWCVCLARAAEGAQGGG
jgi:hypothetical protein